MKIDKKYLSSQPVNFIWKSIEFSIVCEQTKPNQTKPRRNEGAQKEKVGKHKRTNKGNDTITKERMGRPKESPSPRGNRFNLHLEQRHRIAVSY